MTVHYSDESVQLHHGDCLDVLRELPDNSVDSVVTDPPAGISFMGKGWDGDKGGREQWSAWLADVMREALRVTKPGGHALVWALPRTAHWTACGLEDAGWEIRDRITHLYGSGFPKSLDVSKAIDKAAGATREVMGHADPSDPRTAMARGIYGTSLQEGPGLGVPITASATGAARRWQGWGTALKPGAEDWWVGRKPLAGTVAANVLAHGTGALNVDGCRVEAHDGPRSGGGVWNTFQMGGFSDLASLEAAVVRGETSSPKGKDSPQALLRRWLSRAEQMPSTAGRWPTNVVLDGHAAEELDAEVGASRFFPVFRYQAKAPTRERPNVGDVRHPTVKPLALMQWLVRLVTPPGGVVLEPFAGSGTTVEACLLEGFRCIAIEREADYLPLIEARIARQRKPDVPTAAEALALFDFEEPA